MTEGESLLGKLQASSYLRWATSVSYRIGVLNDELYNGDSSGSRTFVATMSKNEGLVAQVVTFEQPTL